MSILWRFAVVVWLIVIPFFSIPAFISSIVILIVLNALGIFDEDFSTSEPSSKGSE